MARKPTRKKFQAYLNMMRPPVYEQETGNFLKFGTHFRRENPAMFERGYIQYCARHADVEEE